MLVANLLSSVLFPNSFGEMNLLLIREGRNKYEQPQTSYATSSPTRSDMPGSLRASLNATRLLSMNF